MPYPFPKTLCIGNRNGQKQENIQSNKPNKRIFAQIKALRYALPMPPKPMRQPLCTSENKTNSKLLLKKALKAPKYQPFGLFYDIFSLTLQSNRHKTIN